jgi:BirA family biotin operon repressor/biotin-[acetyl-CoA-carboxylase] ligase
VREPKTGLRKPAYSDACCPGAVDNPALINALMDGPKSGVRLAAEFGVSRAAVWKRIEYLRECGLPIDTDTQRGYRLARPTPLLAKSAILAAMDAASRHCLQSLQVDFETDSTQLRAMTEPAPEQGIAVWLAEMQTAGQGRRGKRWCSPPLANIHCSINRRFNVPVAAMSGFSLACAVIIVQSLQQQGIAGLTLKWPNDLWLQGRKCGGLLIQLRGEADGPCDVTLGFGINVHLSRQAGVGIDQDWAALAEYSQIALDRNHLLAGLLSALLRGFELFESDGLPAFIDAWRAMDALQGRAVQVEEAGRVRIGRACGIGDDGALLFEDAKGGHRLHSGEVSVRVSDG